MSEATLPLTKHQSQKPLGQNAYGSIPHLPGSRRGPADKGLSDQQARLLTGKPRDRHDVVHVEEKLDGSNTSVALYRGTPSWHSAPFERYAKIGKIDE